MLFQNVRNVFNTIEAVYVRFFHPSINSKLLLLQESLQINKTYLCDHLTQGVFAVFQTVSR